MAMIPAMTTGMSAFITKSGRKVPIPAIPTPLFAVPYAAPTAAHRKKEKVKMKGGDGCNGEEEEEERREERREKGEEEKTM